ncbi:MAG TPA: hypothetical protein DCP53_08565 [Elusimicrobia bacterium]|nr:hypothetical protein [Elusimicrobiota bacterium]
MAYRLTRLQVIFLIGIFFLVFNICNRIYRAWLSSNRKAPVVLQQEENEYELVEERFRKEQQLKNIESTARQHIAITGEKIRIKKRDGYDVAPAQEVLRKAKDSFTASDYEIALVYSRESSVLIDSASKIAIPKRVHIVQSGDCLWYISKKYFKRGSNWYDIWKANEEKIPDFDLIYRNQSIVIPAIQKNS